MATATTKRWKTKYGHLYIQDDECKGCNFCIQFCPKDVLEASDKFNAKGYFPPRPKNPEACVNCTYCELVCPDFAIWSTKDDEESGKTEAATGGSNE